MVTLDGRGFKVINVLKIRTFHFIKKKKKVKHENFYLSTSTTTNAEILKVFWFAGSFSHT